MQFCFQNFIFYQRQNILTSLPCFVDVVVMEKDSFKLAPVSIKGFSWIIILELQNSKD